MAKNRSTGCPDQTYPTSAAVAQVLTAGVDGGARHSIEERSTYDNARGEKALGMVFVVASAAG